MKNHLLASLMIFIIGLQTLSLPLSLGFFYANQAEIAATKCVNRFEAVNLCSGKCYLREIMVTQLNPPAEQSAPLPDKGELKLPVLLLDQPPHSPLFSVIDVARKLLPAANFITRSMRSSTYIDRLLRPPRA